MGEWKKVKLGDCIEEVNEKTIENNQYEVLTSSKSGIYSQEDYFDKQVASKDNTGYKIIKRGQFTYRSMSDNSTFTINRLENKDIGIVSPAYPVFEAIDINAKYLKYFFQFEGFRKEIYNLSQGSTRTALKYKDLSNIEILLPPVDEQEKIVEILEKVDIIIRKNEELNIIIKKMKEAILNSIQSNNNIVSLNDWCELIKDGTHGSHKDVEYGIPLLSAKDIENGKLRIPDNCRRISEEDYRKIHKNFKIQKGDILLTIVGTIGKTAIVETEDKFTLQRSVAIIRPKSDINGKYLYYYLGTKFYLRQLLFESNESAQSGVYLGSLAKSKVIKLEKNIETKLTDVLEILDKKNEVVMKNIKEYKKLKQGLMQQLLTGKVRVKI